MGNNYCGRGCLNDQVPSPLLLLLQCADKPLNEEISQCVHRWLKVECASTQSALENALQRDEHGRDNATPSRSTRDSRSNAPTPMREISKGRDSQKKRPRHGEEDGAAKDSEQQSSFAGKQLSSATQRRKQCSLFGHDASGDEAKNVETADVGRAGSQDRVNPEPPDFVDLESTPSAAETNIPLFGGSLAGAKQQSIICEEVTTDEIQALKTSGRFVSSRVLDFYIALLKQDRTIVRGPAVAIFDAAQSQTWRLARGTPATMLDDSMKKKILTFQSLARTNKMLMFPGCVRNHFVTVVIDVESSRILWFDSLNGYTNEDFLHPVREFLWYAFEEEFKIARLECPQQAEKSNDCAVFVLSFLRSLLESAGRTHVSEHGPLTEGNERQRLQRGKTLRERFAEEIIQKKLRAWK